MSGSACRIRCGGLFVVALLYLGGFARHEGLKICPGFGAPERI